MKDTLKKAWYRNAYPPLLVAARHFGTRRFRCLDVGCGPFAALRFKTLFPACEYHGLEHPAKAQRQDMADARGAADAFHFLDLAGDGLRAITDEHYDYLVFSHVVEHLHHGEEVLARLMAKVRPGGLAYVEFPSLVSLGLPSMRPCLNFCDDPTHVRVYTIQEVANVLLASGWRLLKAGRRRNLARIAALPATLFMAAREGQGLAVSLWDLLGFADYVLAVKSEPNGHNEGRAS